MNDDYIRIPIPHYDDPTDRIKREILTQLWHAAQARGEDPWMAIGMEKPRVRVTTRPLTTGEAFRRIIEPVMDEVFGRAYKDLPPWPF